MREEQIILHGAEGFQGMRAAGALAAEVLDMITDGFFYALRLEAAWERRA